MSLINIEYGSLASSETMNKNFADLLDDYAGYLPMSEMPIRPNENTR